PQNDCALSSSPSKAYIRKHRRRPASHENSNFRRLSDVSLVEGISMPGARGLNIKLMLKVTGNGSITTCDGITRRDFLQVGALGAIGLTLAKYATLEALGAVSKGNDEKAAIMIFNLGAPSQLDTW